MNKSILSKLAAIVTLCGIAISTPVCARNDNNLQWNNNQQRYAFKRNPYNSTEFSKAAETQRNIIEAKLLILLDKQGRQFYYSLNEKGKLRALQIADDSPAIKNLGRYSYEASQDAQSAVERASKEVVEEDKVIHSRMLHNGMDRVQRKIKENQRY